MRVVLSADMEAISLIESARELGAFERAYWEHGRERITADVVAACVGLLAADADEVIVLDNHGSGNPENVIADRLPEGARLETWNVFDVPAHGIDAMLQVGYHARAGVDSFVPHTYVPRLRLRVDGQLIGESHGRAWAAGVPLLGIVGNEAHRRTLGSLSPSSFLAVQGAGTAEAPDLVFGDPGEAAEAIATFAADALRGGGLAVDPPRSALFEASIDDVDDDSGLAAAGWRRTSDTVFAVELDRWSDARQPLAAAMAAGFGRWLPYFSAGDLGSRASVEAAYNEQALAEGRAALERWTSEAPYEEWVD